MAETRGEPVAIGPGAASAPVDDNQAATLVPIAAAPAPACAPITTTYKFPIFIDRPGIEAIARLLEPVLGALEFRARTSDLSNHKGVTLESVVRKELYGNGHVRELWITRQDGSMGIYFQGSPDDTVRVFLPGEAKDAAKAIGEILKKYWAPYWRLSVEPLWGFANTYLLLPYFVGTMLTGLVHSPHAAVDAVGSLVDQVSSAASSPSTTPISQSRTTGAWIAWGIFKGAIGFALLVALVTVLLLPLRAIVRLAFPMLAFDLEPNMGRNRTAISLRYAFLGIPISSFLAGLFG